MKFTIEGYEVECTPAEFAELMARRAAPARPRGGVLLAPSGLAEDAPTKDYVDAQFSEVLPVVPNYPPVSPGAFRAPDGQIYIPNSRAEAPVVTWFLDNPEELIGVRDLALKLVGRRPTSRAIAAMQAHVFELARHNPEKGHWPRGLMRVPATRVYRLSEEGRQATFVTVGQPRQALARWRLNNAVD